MSFSAPLSGRLFRLVCFPGAGGTKELFARWPDLLPDSVSVTCVQYPGRAERLGDPMPQHLEELAEPVAAELAATAATGAPVVLFGHGMGAWVAWETARRLQDTHPGTPHALFASAQAAPAHPGSGPGPFQESPAPRDPGVPLATAQADSRLAARYRAHHRHGPPLKCPVTVLVGTHDTNVTTRHAQSWRAYTTGPFTVRALRGDGPGIVRRAGAIAFLLTSLGLPRAARTPRRSVNGEAEPVPRAAPTTHLPDPRRQPMPAPLPHLTPLEPRVLQDIHTEVLTKIPYNSAAQYHIHYGEGSSPERFGTACAWQTFAVGERVARRTGVQVEYRVGGRHVCALHDDGETLTVLDPYLMHRAPLRLARADAVDGTVRGAAEAYPVRRGRDGSPVPSSVRAAWEPGSGVLRLRYLRHSPRLDETVTHRAYTMRPEETVGELPVPAPLVRELLMHPEQNNLSIRALHPDGGLCEIALPFTVDRRGRLADQRFLITRDNQGAVSRWGDRDFDQVLERVADALLATTDEVVDHVLSAAALYDAAAPLGLDVPEYSLEDA